MSEMKFESVVMGVPREKIDWSPRIDWELCNHCMECDEFCKHSVFTRVEGKLVLQNPDNCVVFCRACVKTCGLDAITFPDKAKTTALIKQMRKEAEAGEP